MLNINQTIPVLPDNEVVLEWKHLLLVNLEANGAKVTGHI